MDKARISSRRKDFKKNFEDPRRQREDEAVQIRKAQRDAQVSQKRAQACQPATGMLGTMNPSIELQLAVKYVMSDDPEKHLLGTQQFRRLLAVDVNPPIQEVVDTGTVPRLVHFLRDYTKPQLQLEAAWTLTNIASGTQKQTRIVTDNGAIPMFVELLCSPKEDVRDQAVWALGNIAGDCAACRDMVLQSGALIPLLKQITDNKKTNLLRNATWAFSNLCRGTPGPEFTLLRPGLPVLRDLIHSHDVEVLTDACWALSYLLDTRNNSQIDEIIATGVCPRLVDLLGHPNSLVQNPALRSIGQIIAGTHEQTEVMIQAGVLPPLVSLLGSSKVPIRKEACWVISNIAAGTSSQIQSLISRGVIEVLVRLLSTSELEVRREVAWALSNAVIGGTSQQIEHIVQCQAIKPLCDLLGVSDPHIVQVALEAIDNILRVGQEKKECQALSENPYVQCVEEADGFAKLERLQLTDPDGEIYKTVMRVLQTYFQIEEDGFDDGPDMMRDEHDDTTLDKGASDFRGFGVSVPQSGFHFGGS